RPARSRRSPWLSSYRPHHRPPFQRWRLHHNQLVPSPLPSRFPSTARLLLNYLQASRVYPAGLILYLPSSTPTPHRSTSRIPFAARVPFALIERTALGTRRLLVTVKGTSRG